MKKSRKMYFVQPAQPRPVLFTPAYKSFYESKIRCPGQYCGYLGQTNYCSSLDKEFLKSRTPLNVELETLPRGAFIYVDLCSACIVRTDLLDALQPYLSSPILGNVKVARGNKTDTGYTSIYSPPEHWIDMHRAAHAMHNQCPTCHRIHNVNHSVSYCAVEYSLDERLVYTEDGITYVFDERLITERKLRERFPDLQFRHIPIIPRPLDNDVLPGDPDWSGAFRSQDILTVSARRSANLVDQMSKNVSDARAKLGRPTSN